MRKFNKHNLHARNAYFLLRKCTAKHADLIEKQIQYNLQQHLQYANNVKQTLAIASTSQVQLECMQQHYIAVRSCYTFVRKALTDFEITRDALALHNTLTRTYYMGLDCYKNTLAYIEQQRLVAYTNNIVRNNL
jgi:hypothetical protein